MDRMRGGFHCGTPTPLTSHACRSLRVPKEHVASRWIRVDGPVTSATGEAARRHGVREHFLTRLAGLPLRSRQLVHQCESMTRTL